MTTLELLGVHTFDVLLDVSLPAWTSRAVYSRACSCGRVGIVCLRVTQHLAARMGSEGRSSRHSVADDF